MKLLLETHAEQKVLLSKLLRQQNNSLELNQSFPIPSIEKLIALNSVITDENKHAYVSINKYLIHTYIIHIIFNNILFLRLK